MSSPSAAAIPYFFTTLPDASSVYKTLCSFVCDLERLLENSDGTLRERYKAFVEQAGAITSRLSDSNAQLICGNELTEGLIPIREDFAELAKIIFNFADRLVEYVRVLRSRNLEGPSELTTLEFITSTLDIMKVCQHLLSRTLGKGLSDIMLDKYATILLVLVTSETAPERHRCSHGASCLSGTRPTGILEIGWCEPPIIDQESFAKKRSLLKGRDTISVLSKYLFPAAVDAEYDLINSYRAYLKSSSKGMKDPQGFPSGYQRLAASQETLLAETRRLQDRKVPSDHTLLQDLVRGIFYKRCNYVGKGKEEVLNVIG